LLVWLLKYPTLHEGGLRLHNKSVHLLQEIGQVSVQSQYHVQMWGFGLTEKDAILDVISRRIYIDLSNASVRDSD